MRKRVLFFLFVMLVSVELLSASFFKPKFALVLGGGGAKGLAHIPIIQELDRRGIVPDMVLGTSAGALIGGLYAAGYDGDELEEIVTENDIMNYIFHLYAVRPRELIPSPFTDFETNLLTVEFGTTGFGAANAILDDQYINAFLRRYIAKVMEVEDFDDLPIAFRAIGTDITNNRKMVFDSGSLFEALRASMAIPLVFAPVQLEDGSWIMDGGTEDNLPIDVARDLGADIVLAVDVADAGRVHPDSVPDMHTLSGAFTGFTDYLSRPAVLAQYENADWVIVPDVGTFSALDFGSKSTEELLEAGREAVAENADVFDELERRLAPYKDDMEYTHYSELPTPVIEKVLPNGVPASYRETLVSFEGRPMDYETISEFEAFLDDIRTHDAQFVQQVKEQHPDSEIFLQSILPVTQEFDDERDDISNEKINQYNELVVQIAENEGVHYLDVASVFKDDQGCLPADSDGDGMHFGGKYYNLWFDYLRTHTVTEE